MLRYLVKLVPDDKPDADGTWVSVERGHPPTFDDGTIRPGHHVVQVAREEPYNMHEVLRGS